MNTMIVNKNAVKVIVMAYSVLQDSDTVTQWLISPSPNLGNRSPLYWMSKGKYKQLLLIMDQDADEAIKRKQAAEKKDEPENPTP